MTLTNSLFVTESNANQQHEALDINAFSVQKVTLSLQQIKYYIEHLNESPIQSFKGIITNDDGSECIATK